MNISGADADLVELLGFLEHENLPLLYRAVSLAIQANRTNYQAARDASSLRVVREMNAQLERRFTRLKELYERRTGRLISDEELDSRDSGFDNDFIRYRPVSIRGLIR